jgi:hypothetical protein
MAFFFPIIKQFKTAWIMAKPEDGDIELERQQGQQGTSILGLN